MKKASIIYPMKNQKIKRDVSYSMEKIKRNVSHSVERIKRNVSHSVEVSEVKDESDPETESNSDEINNNATQTNFNNTRPYLITYLLMFCVLGFNDSADASIYTDIQHQLNTSTVKMSWIYSAGAFAMIFSSFISGYIIDKYIETHRYATIMLCLDIITGCLIPFINNIPIMFVLFILSGFAFAAVDTCSAVWIFRVYPQNGGQMYFLFDTVRDVIGTITPLIFQLSISKTTQYSYPIFLFSFIGFIVMILLLFLPTPKHDKLRTIKRDIAAKIKLKTKETTVDISVGEEINPLKESENLSTIDEKKLTEMSVNASVRLKQHPKYTQMQCLIISIFIVIMFFYGAFSEGSGVFILTYCVDYLKVDESLGRYLIAVFMAANVLYRIVDLFLEHICKIKLNVLCIIMVANVIQLIACVLFICFGDIIPVLYVVYAIWGFAGSPTYPGICDVIEEVRPITGFISCMIGVGFLAGDAIFTLVTGMLIQIFGAGIFPYALNVPI
eukprot:81073_1